MADVIFIPIESSGRGYRAWFLGTMNDSYNVILKYGKVKPVEADMVTDSSLRLNSVYVGRKALNGRKDKNEESYEHEFAGDVMRPNIEVRCNNFEKFVPKSTDKSGIEIARWHYDYLSYLCTGIENIKNESECSEENKVNESVEVIESVDAEEIELEEELSTNDATENAGKVIQMSLGNIESRYTGAQKKFMESRLNARFNKCNDLKDQAIVKLRETMNEHIGSYGEDESYYINFANNLKKNWKDPKIRGIFIQMFEKCVDGGSIKINGDSVPEAMHNMDPNWLKKAFRGSDSLKDKIKAELGEKQANKLLKVLSYINECNAVVWLGMLCGLSGANFNTFRGLAEIKSIQYILPQIILGNPYDLYFIRRNISMVDVDKLAIAVGKFNGRDSKLMTERGVHDMIKELSAIDSTVFSANIFDTDGKKKFGEEKLSVNTKLPSTMGISWNIINVLYDLSVPAIAGLDTDIVKVNYKELLKSAEGAGLLVKVGDVYSSLYDMDKELYVYFKLKYMANKSLNIEFDADNYIEEFEKSKDKEFELTPGTFKLEGKQRDAVKLISKNAVILTGPPGSGKTTTAEAMLFALEAVRGLSDEQIHFTAPTGRAASRLKEVVKRKTKTLHSEFKIMSSEGDYTDDNGDDIAVLFVDESSMINLDLMFRVLLKVDENTQIIFLGDADQLPPIGKGRPFVDALHYLDCVKLDVSKRSSEKSTITRNCKKIANEIVSNIYDYDRASNWLDAGDDFKCIQVDAADMIPEIVSIVKHQLGIKINNNNKDYIQDTTVDRDDIQIMSPVRVKREFMCTDKINEAVHDIFNPKVQGKKDYYRANGSNWLILRDGDRVIHTKNNYKKLRYKRLDLDAGVIMMTNCEGGICNGEIGKIVGYVRADKIDIVEAPGMVDFDEFLSKMVDDRVDRSEAASTGYFIVKYPDCSSEFDEDVFYILYEATLSESPEIDDGLLAQGVELMNLDLAYALTVHKLQGSQAKMIIMAVAHAPNMSRNMLYTGISRAQKYGYLVGSIYKVHKKIDGTTGKVSAVASARKNEEVEKRDTVINKIVELIK